MTDKGSFRKKYKKLREELNEESLENGSLSIANRALNLPIWEASYYHVFLSISEKKEVNTQYLLHILQGRDKSIVVSKSNFESHQMQHFLLQENTRFTVSNYGIPEPHSGIEVPVDQIDVVFVPLLAFDENGHRVGYGKGFYDRFLSQCRSDTIFIGVSLFKAEKSINLDFNDIPLNYCITPSKTYAFK